MSQSEELTAFYKSYLEWLENGAPHNEPYNRRWGLCTNLEKFIFLNKFSYKLLDELESQFIDAGLNKRYPFGKANYSSCFKCETQHLDPKRIQWVKDHIPK